MTFKKLNFNELTKELDKHKFKQLHIHHTWKPTHKSFTGNNHIVMQQSMKNYHVNTNKWSDIAQHLTLFPDGIWLTGRPFNIAPASISGWNTGALCVEMVGNFDTKGTGQFNDLGYDELKGQQKQEILKLIKYFIDKYGEQSIKFHRENANKTCPGTSLDKNKLIQEAKNIDKLKIEEMIKVELLKWQEEMGIKSLDSLNKKKDNNGNLIVNAPEDWKKTLGDNVPQWLFWSIIDRISK